VPFDALVLFAKVPQPGRVKTRLGREIGASQASELYALFLKYLSWNFRRLPGGLRLFIAVHPRGGRKAIRRFFPWQRNPRVFAQKGADLGERMLRATRAVSRLGARKVLLAGSDCLELKSGHLRRALGFLEHKELVLGKALDGGYYLLGWKRPRMECFKGVAWGTSRVLEKTLWNGRKLGFNIGLLPALSDVDAKKDLPRLGRRLDRRNPLSKQVREFLSALAREG